MDKYIKLVKALSTLLCIQTIQQFTCSALLDKFYDAVRNIIGVCLRDQGEGIHTAQLQI